MPITRDDRYYDHQRVSIRYLRECFDYDAERGLLTWRRRPRSHFRHLRQFVSVNARDAGHLAGSLSPSGYLDVTIDGQKFRVHRVIWAMHTGEWPALRLDHENRNKIDNRFANLREATCSQNGANQPANKRNKIGLKGVSAHNSRYRAQIKSGGKVRYLGMFDTPELAHAAYCRAARQHHGQFAGGLLS